MVLDVGSLDAIKLDAEAKIASSKSIIEIDAIDVLLFGKSGIITAIASGIKNVAAEEKKNYGSTVNVLKNDLLAKIALKRSEVKKLSIAERINGERCDVTIPCYGASYGKLHPVRFVIKEIEDIFHSMGFRVSEGCEIEDVYYNFTAANIPEGHPARQMHDTFYIKGSVDKILRTHTTPIQIHEMLRAGAPIRIIAPGRVYRSDYDATHTPVFHQVEGLVIESGINFCNLVSCVTEFQKRFFGLDHLELRLRPSYFPFTEPSAEIDIPYSIQNGKIVVGNGDTFLEVMGCGMVHPEVLKNGGIDHEKYVGFAFGFGVERLASLKYGIPDLRGYFEIDKNWKDTFGFEPFN